MNLDSSQDDGEWEVIQRKPKNRGGSSGAKPWGSQNSNPKPWNGGMRGNAGPGRGTGGNAWANHGADSRMASGRGNSRPQIVNKSLDNHQVPSNPVIRPPLEHGWNWQSRTGSNPSKGFQDGYEKDNVNAEAEKDNDVDDIEDDSDDVAADDSDNELLTDEFDSDSSQKSHETRKKNRWFKKFFDSLDKLRVEEINDPARQWHCPACQGGPGAIDWYRGLQPLVTHAKTKGSKRVKLHRELAELLDEELRRRGTSVIPAGEAFGKWRGLKDVEKDHEIVWPPMVIIMNTRLQQDDNDKGHRGMSLLIFESPARGYLEAERLHKHFAEQGTDREAWEHRKSKLKFEMRSYQEMVVNQIRQMSEANQELIFYKNKFAIQQRLKTALEESFCVVSEKLRKTMEENRIVRQRTKMQHEQNKEEMDFQEQFFNEQIKFIHEARDEKEEKFEKLQQQQREKFVKQSTPSTSNTEEYRRRADEIAKFIKLQDEEMEAFVSERDKLITVHKEKMAAMRQRHWQEEVELEKEFD
ncbi:hypothetical protein Gogos_007318 [Gossypium gossypioides]|uniref:Protein SUPPRESSOR OF GENE SILENCING 3-like n=1 Tax=Gossypium gossypioides TaxID=34282 RepID=A0A7J9C915_GOSGO|nr:hypothetical protein [Gossypium gossypioides]